MRHIPYQNIQWEHTETLGVEVSSIFENLEKGGIKYWKVKKGSGFKKHSHKGYEHILVVEGSMEFSNIIVRKGGMLVTSKDEVHEAVALVDSVILVINERSNTQN